MKLNKAGQVGISITGLVIFMVSFIVLISLMPIILDFIADANNMTNLSSGTKVVINLIPLMLGISALVGAISTKAE